VPIFNHEKKPVASIVIAGPSQRITANDNLTMVAALKEAGAEISAQLYYQKP
jgi:DNA-binding IclR family transcriptional regulator